jgi:hypothetical protein
MLIMQTVMMTAPLLRKRISMKVQAWVLAGGTATIIGILATIQVPITTITTIIITMVVGLVLRAQLQMRPKTRIQSSTLRTRLTSLISTTSARTAGKLAIIKVANVQAHSVDHTGIAADGASVAMVATMSDAITIIAASTLLTLHWRKLPMPQQSWFELSGHGLSKFL